MRLATTTPTTISIKLFFACMLLCKTTVFGQALSPDYWGSLLKRALFTCPLLEAQPVFEATLSDPRTTVTAQTINDLLSCGAQANKPILFSSDKRLISPLMLFLLNHGATDDAVESVKSFINHGALLNTPNAQGDTPLLYAVKYASPAVVALLLENGAAVNTQNKLLVTPLQAVFSKNASLNEKLKLVQLLLAYGANPNLADNDGLTAVYYALKERLAARDTQDAVYADNVLTLLQILKELLHAGAKLSVYTTTGETPLMFAVYYMADPHIIRLLVGNGANPHTKNNLGKTVLDVLYEDLQNPNYADYAEEVLQLISATKAPRT